jgi:hypothetical protein
VIVATEDLFGLTEADATIVHVGKRANQLLDEDRYDEVSNAVGVRTYPANALFRPHIAISHVVPKRRPVDRRSGLLTPILGCRFSQ